MEVEREIARGFPLLRFSPLLEQKFESDVSVERCRRLILINVIGLAIFHIFLLATYRSIGDAIWVDLAMRFLLTTPIVLGVNVVLARHPPVWARESAETVAALAVAVTIFVVCLESRLPDRDIVFSNLSVIVLCMITMQRLRFPYAVAGCVIIQAAYSIGLVVMEFSGERLLVASSVFLGIVLVSLVGGYSLERESRMGYLLRLREQIRSQNLETTSLRDALTGVGNRRALDAALTRLTGGNAASSASTAILLLDVDHFKQFNDTNGHQAGDVCLKRVADVVASSLRLGEGHAYRFGGEEFLVLVEDVTFSAALGIAARIRANVESEAIPRDRAARGVVTVSVGVAHGTSGADRTLDMLIDLADRALYAAKNAGRNRVFPESDGNVVPVGVSDRRMAG